MLVLSSSLSVMITGVTVSLSESSVTVTEEVGVVNISLVLTGLHSIPVSVSVTAYPTTATGMCTHVVAVCTCTCTTSAGDDYQMITETVTFDPGVSSGSVLVAIVNDDIREDTETFEVRFMIRKVSHRLRKQFTRKCSGHNSQLDISPIPH